MIISHTSARPTPPLAEQELMYVALLPPAYIKKAQVFLFLFLAGSHIQSMVISFKWRCCALLPLLLQKNCTKDYTPH